MYWYVLFGKKVLVCTYNFMYTSIRMYGLCTYQLNAKHIAGSSFAKFFTTNTFIAIGTS